MPSLHSLDFSKLSEAAPIAAFAAPAGALILGSAILSMFRTFGWVLSFLGSAAMALLFMAAFFKPELQSMVHLLIG